MSAHVRECWHSIYFEFISLRGECRAEEIALELRKLTVLLEDPNSISSIHTVVHSTSSRRYPTPVAGDQTPASFSMGIRQAHGTQTYVQAEHPYT